MFGKPKQLLLILLPLMGLLTACERIYEDLAPCEVYLEFRFEHNLDFEDQFKPLVGSVDVFIFDSNEKLVLIQEMTASELINGNRMALSDMLDYGSYKVLTVGNLSDNFCVTDHSGLDLNINLISGQTHLDEVILKLDCEPDGADVEFPHLYFGEAIEVEYNRSLTANTVLPVYLIRNTNNFQIQLENSDAGQGGQSTGTLSYAVEIITPEGAIYDRNNEPVEFGSPVTFLPYRANISTAQYQAVSYLNTCRLFDRSDYSYELVVRESESGQQVWKYDLIDLLRATQSGLAIPFQEYLDRRGEWDLIVYYRGGESEGDAFIAFAIQVNGWILWINDFGTDGI